MQGLLEGCNRTFACVRETSWVVLPALMLAVDATLAADTCAGQSSLQGLKRHPVG